MNDTYDYLMMIDSGTSFIAMPEEDFHNLISYLLDFDVACKAGVEFTDFWTCLCPDTKCSNAPDIQFQIMGSDGEYKMLILNST